MLTLLISKLIPTESFDAAVLACALCAMYGQCHLGELLPPTERIWDITLIPLVNSLLPSSTPAGSRVLVLPFTKTTGSKGAKVVLCRQSAECDPIACLESHLEVNKLGPAHPLFGYRTPRGVLCLTKKLFMNRCAAIWAEMEGPSVTGHSFRIGGTTELLLKGVPPDVVKMMGRWKSDAFLRYWRSVESIATMHAEFLDLR